MTRSELLTELRFVLNAPSENATWLDSTLYGYLAEGQDKFCELTGYFSDVTTHAVELVEDQAVYPIPERIIQVLDIWDGARKLRKVVTGEVFEYEESNRPYAWQTDQETGVLLLHPTPNADSAGDSFMLQVWRYSEEDLAESGVDPELPGRFQRACIEWAAYKAFNHHDIEAQDPVKAKDHYALFRSYVSDGKQALRRIQNVETRVSANPAYRT